MDKNYRLCCLVKLKINDVKESKISVSYELLYVHTTDFLLLRL